MSIGCEHICLLLMNDTQSHKPASYSFNIHETDVSRFKQIASKTDFFSNVPEGICFDVGKTVEPVRSVLSLTAFHSIYPFHINRNSAYGALIFCFRSERRLTEDQLRICRIIKIHMEQLIEKIHFRKQVLKQQSYETLFNTLRMKDSFTVSHCYNVAFYSALLGSKAGVSETELEQLKLAALLHDIGKIAIPDSILLKPDRLTDEEFDVIRQHPIVGYELLKDLPDVKSILPIVRWHHERIDGLGYPDGLSGDSIPLLVRIVSLADAFDAMTSTRVYRDSLSVHEVRKQLLINANKQFDEHLVRIFLDTIDEYMIMDRFNRDD
ncbi:HD-GYP domain-containing protein [Paenibacillus beijingensis]|uniref:HD-GYP domain-containing protein n=1 Tax=Paenibacillus beijingensis TaxID=1126833 RepID=UPI00130DB5B4|nr:HD-GYP domain-containing protein [Paenibacillus beijingensis]